MKKKLGFASALMMVGAGVVHLVHAAAHREQPQLFGFFVAVGVIQLGLAAVMGSGRTTALWAGIAVNSGLIGLYAATRFAPVPGLATEPVEAIAIAAKMLEAATIVGAALVLRSIQASASTPGIRDASAFSRRQLLRAGSITAAGLVSGGVLGRMAPAGARQDHGLEHVDPSGHFGNAAVGSVDTSAFDPMAYLREFDRGKTSTLPDGRTLREFQITAVDIELEVAPGVFFPAWAYNGKVPGPTIRATEGEVVRIHFRNEGSHPHTIHFHGFHSAGMDGVFEIVKKGESFTYEFVAEPFGMHHYHCHVTPLKRHIHKGLYGVFISAPAGGRPPADELVMTMNAFDTNFDAENEIYAVNTVAHHYLRNPIEIKRGELIRIYLLNITEFDLLNSFHPHATFFNEYRTGTKLEPDNFTDTVILGQGERSILELTYKDPGDYMFHAHVSEFAELGWMGLFRVK
jgi:FtsP/CotA-like multicopper oxidase with cupredoxin domain